MFQRNETTPKILFADRRPMSDESMRLLHAAGQVVWAEGNREADLVQDMKDAEVVISGVRAITREAIIASEQLKAAIAYGVGFDHIDVAAATEKGVYVVNTPGVNSISVAEFALGLMIGVARKIPQLHEAVRVGKWLRWELLGNELHGKTLGMVGFGRVGTHLATLARGLGMSVLVFDPYVPKEKASELGVELLTLEPLLTRADFVVVCCALTDETRGLLGEKALTLLKPTAYLVNVARGPIVDEQALIKALREKRIAGAALDVFEKEPPDANNPLLTLENVILSPHIAGVAQDASKRISVWVAEDVVRVLNHEPPKYPANPEVLGVRRSEASG